MSSRKDKVLRHLSPWDPDCRQPDNEATPFQTADSLQRIIDLYSVAYESFGVKVSALKAKIMIQHEPRPNSPSTNITINGQLIEVLILLGVSFRKSLHEKDVEN